MKRLITGNTGPNGTLDKDSFAIAVLQYRNTPDPETKLSPGLFHLKFSQSTPIF